MDTVVVIGNPKLGSRTRKAAEMLATRLTGEPASAVIEVAELGPGLLSWGDPGVGTAKETVKSASLLIVASPTYKAAYTGLLKLFLDQFSAGELIGVTAIPLMLGAAPHHALAPELLLRPVLTEIGCSCPLPGLYLLDSQYSDSPELSTWLRRAQTVLSSAVGGAP
jgi:FMN reductase